MVSAGTWNVFVPPRDSVTAVLKAAEKVTEIPGAQRINWP